MKINKDDFKKIVNFAPIAGTSEEPRVSLYIISRTLGKANLKKLDLAKLSPEEREKKFRKWAEEKRFAAVVEIGNRFIAHTNAKFHGTLDQENLTLDGKKVDNITFQALNEDEYDQLSLIGQAFEHYLLENEQLVEKEEEEHDHSISFHQAIREYLTKSSLMSDRMHMNYLIARFENVPRQVILNFLRRMNEDRIAEQRQKEKDDKNYKIKQQEIQKEILKEEITRGEIHRQENNQGKIAEDLESLRLKRGTQE